ncbi:MAG TPA: DUF58 domain-containing protein [Thermoanaerobaculia bacterium]|nr:DUF58 domain-containing protein [Thermoanaerobaculia bacterium]
MSANQPVHGTSITKVGLWLVLLGLIVGIAATNTGNNGLYMGMAGMAALLLVGWLGSWINLRDLSVELEAPDEVFANQPFDLLYRLEHRGRLLPRWLMMVQVEDAQPGLVARLQPTSGSARRAAGRSDLDVIAPTSSAEGTQELLCPRRGRKTIEGVQLASLFPLGFFRSARFVQRPLELIVYPELFSAANLELDRSGLLGMERAPRAGWGHDLHSLRAFREGDDPRSIHWKRSARLGDLVFREREAEDSMRLSVVFDNGTGELAVAADRERFERLVSEAATACVDFLDRGWEVELVTRERLLPFGQGQRQRRRVLETLALLESCERGERTLRGSSQAPQIRFGLERREPGRREAKAS